MARAAGSCQTGLWWPMRAMGMCDGVSGSTGDPELALCGRSAIYHGCLSLEPPRPRKLKPKGTGRPPSASHYGKQRPVAAKEVAQQAQGWKKVRWREGRKGWLESRFWTARVQPTHGFHEGSEPVKEIWLLIEWPEKTAQPTIFGISFATCLRITAPSTISASRQSTLEDRAGLHYQQLKEELGLDHYEGRKLERLAPARHVTLVMLAHSFLTLETLRNKKTSGWTLPRTRREIQRLLCTWTGSCCYCGSLVRAP